MLYTHKGVFLNLKSLVIKKLSPRQVAQDHEENYETFYELDLGSYVNKLKNLFLLSKCASITRHLFNSAFSLKGILMQIQKPANIFVFI